uniref:Protein RCC2 homolog n=1 Tax=Rhizophora mucronata TaxID=61149 RepID=A0A2P2LUL1_RHIMU
MLMDVATHGGAMSLTYVRRRVSWVMGTKFSVIDPQLFLNSRTLRLLKLEQEGATLLWFLMMVNPWHLAGTNMGNWVLVH